MIRGITSAAIMFKHNVAGNDEIIIIEGVRHHLILEKIREWGLTDDYKKWHEHGFIVVTENYNLNFRTTEECTEWAKEVGFPMRGSVLTSEDVFAADAEMVTCVFEGRLNV